MIQRAMILIITILFTNGCASSRKAVDISIGTWDYEVVLSPEQVLHGWLVISRDGENYTGTINSEEGSLQLEGLTIEDGKMKCSFFYEGMDVVLTGVFERNTFTGKVTADYEDYPVTADKRKE